MFDKLLALYGLKPIFLRVLENIKKPMVLVPSVQKDIDDKRAHVVLLTEQVIELKNKLEALQTELIKYVNDANEDIWNSIKDVYGLEDEQAKYRTLNIDMGLLYEVDILEFKEKLVLILGQDSYDDIFKDYDDDVAVLKQILELIS